MFGDVVVQRWHRKKSRKKIQIKATLTLVGVAGILPSLRVTCLDLISARATFKWNNPYHAGGEMLVWIIKCEYEVARRLSSSASPGNDLRGRQRAYHRR